MNDVTLLQDFAARYAYAWCSKDPEKVAAFYAKSASVSVNLKEAIDSMLSGMGCPPGSG